MKWVDRIKRGFDELVDEFSTDDALKALLSSGQEALSAGDLQTAEDRFKAAAAHDPTHAPSFVLLGIVCLRRGQAQSAIEALQRADALKAQDFRTLLFLAQAQQLAAADQDALESARRALRCRTIDERLLDQLHQLRGELYLATGDAERAVRELRKAEALSDPPSAELLGALARGYLATGERTAAREQLERAHQLGQLDADSLSTLANLLLEAGRASDAARVAEIFAASRPRTAALIRARALISAGQAGEARQLLLEALGQAPQDPEIHRLLAQAYLRVDDKARALEQLMVALALSVPAPLDLLTQIVDLLVEVAGVSPESRSAAAALGGLLQAAAPDHPYVRLAAALAESSPAQALRIAEQSFERAPGLTALLLAGELWLAVDEPGRASAVLRHARELAPDNARAKQLFEQAVAGPPIEQRLGLYPALGRLSRLLAGHQGLEQLSARATALQHEYDRPLLVAVMGEFNAGKSTFVNALIGEEIAPMGITPTTATINLLKYGEQRSARVVWRDDRERWINWQDIGRYLSQLPQDQARAIRVVELLYPAEHLLRVNVVDTPGLNSMIAEHEQTAREFIELADAVIWLFSADQAGKESERAALETISRQRVKTIGVINKVDRLDEAQREEVLSHLREGFAELVETVLPLSAKRALAARLQADDAALIASGYSGLSAFLDERIFSRSRRIKSEAIGSKMRDLIVHAAKHLAEEIDPLRATASSLRSALNDVLAPLAEDLCQQEYGQLADDLETVYRQAADDVLDFVRPRKWRFGEHRAGTHDRAFVAGTLERGFARIIAASQARVAARWQLAVTECAERASRLLSAEQGQRARRRLERASELHLERLAGEVYRRFLAFARGFVGGGSLQFFFDHQLKQLELQRDAVAKALSTPGIDLRGELLEPLTNWQQRGAETLGATLSTLAEALRIDADQIEAARLLPLRRIEDSLVGD
ncbi:MAG: dynamin family protein [Deltaproteobacteria bacterium]|nr:dynamin family protein [Deltaproteobacteria bacterium]